MWVLVCPPSSSQKRPSWIRHDSCARRTKPCFCLHMSSSLLPKAKPVRRYMSRNKSLWPGCDVCFSPKRPTDTIMGKNEWHVGYISLAQGAVRLRAQHLQPSFPMKTTSLDVCVCSSSPSKGHWTWQNVYLSLPSEKKLFMATTRLLFLRTQFYL
jgi:hypothetical protein